MIVLVITGITSKLINRREWVGPLLSVTMINVVNNLSTDYLLVTWQIGDTLEDASVYVYDVYRSLSPQDGYILIASVQNVYDYRDYNIDLYDSSIRYYYKIRVTNTVTGQDIMTEDYGQLIYSPPDNVASAIMYHEQKLLELGDNPLVYALIKKRFGPRCPTCWDPVQKKTTISQCTNCFQVSFAGGYMPPTLIRMSFSPTERQERMAMDGIKDVDGVIATWTANYPILQPGDVIVDSLNSRYHVETVTPAIKRRYVMHQVLALRKIPPTGVIYKLLLPQFGEVDFLWRP